MPLLPYCPSSIDNNCLTTDRGAIIRCKHHCHTCNSSGLPSLPRGIEDTMSTLCSVVFLLFNSYPHPPPCSPFWLRLANAQIQDVRLWKTYSVSIYLSSSMHCNPFQFAIQPRRKLLWSFWEEWDIGTFRKSFDYL